MFSLVEQSTICWKRSREVEMEQSSIVVVLASSTPKAKILREFILVSSNF